MCLCVLSDALVMCFPPVFAKAESEVLCECECVQCNAYWMST